MKVIYIVKASTGDYDGNTQRLVAAHATADAAQAHCNAVQAHANDLIAQYAARGERYFLSEVTSLDLDLEVRDGWVRYSVEPLLMPDWSAALGNLCQGGSDLGAARAKLKRVPGHTPAPEVPEGPVEGSFAHQLAAALRA